MDAQSLLRLVILAAIWGGSFLFLRISIASFGPVPLISLRIGLATVFLWAAARLWHRPLPLQHWRYFLLVGGINSVIPFLLFGYAAMSLSAGLLAILNATTPMFGAAAMALWRRESIGRDACLGLVLGAAGVALAAWGDASVTGQNWMLPVSAAAMAAGCYGVAGVIVRQAGGTVTPFDTAHGSLWGATILLLPLALTAHFNTPPQPVEWAAVIVLGLVCSGVAYLLYFRLIGDVGPMKALTVTFLIPIFGMLWGRLFLGEDLTIRKLAGAAVVLVGTALANGILRLPSCAASRRDSPA